MCLVGLALDHHPRFPVVVAANRDEFFDRPAAPLDWWGSPPLLAGRDLLAGGTWLGLTRAGRLAMLTNIRRPPLTPDPEAPSRGAIVPMWLQDAGTPRAFCAALRTAGHSPFNCIAADLAHGQVFFTSSDHPDPQPVPAGVHGLSNATLDTPWPKVVTLTARIDAALAEAADADQVTDQLLTALRDRGTPPDEALPDSGVGLDLERALASAFIHAHDRNYGTRSSTVLVVENTPDGPTAHVVEQTYTPDGAPAGRRQEILPHWPPRAPAD